LSFFVFCFLLLFSFVLGAWKRGRTRAVSRNAECGIRRQEKEWKNRVKIFVVFVVIFVIFCFVLSVWKRGRVRAVSRNTGCGDQKKRVKDRR